MASKKKVRDRRSTFIYELPYSITGEICANLDVDGAWEKLASELNYSDSVVRQFGMAKFRHNDSPTRQILNDWGARNPVAMDLYNILDKIKRRREMQLLQTYFADDFKGQQNVASVPSHKNSNMDSVPDYSDNTPSMILSALDCKALPKPKKFGKPTASSGSWSTSSMNNDATSSSNGDVNLNKPGYNCDKMSKKHVEGKDISSLNKGFNDKNFPEKYDYLSKMKENSGISDRKEKEHEHKSVSSEHVDKLEIDGPPGSVGNMASPAADLSWVEALRCHDGYSTLAREGMSDVDIAVALIGSQSFTSKELNQATNGFSDEFKIGQGAFGEVYQGNLKKTKCAIKRLFQKQESDGDNANGHLKSELKTLIRYRHENIVPLYGYTLDGGDICLVYQYMSNGSLEDRLKCKNGTHPLSWEQRVSIMKGSACGLQYLHTLDVKPLIHGDIKSGNILLDKHMEPKIGDLGLAQHATGGSSKPGQLTHITRKQALTKEYQCKAYLPPEVIRGTNMSIKGDTYSFGVVIYEVCTGEMAYDEKREGSKILVEYVKDYLSEKQENWRELMDRKAGTCVDNICNFFSLGHKCTEKLKKNRPEMVQVYTILEKLEEHFRSTYPSKCTENVESSCSSMQNSNSFASVSDNEMTRMDNISFVSGQNYSPGLMAANPHQSLPQPPARVPHVAYFPGGGVPDMLRNPPAAIPESLRIQMLYDNRKKGDPLPTEAELKTPDTAEVSDYRNGILRSDSRKLEEIQHFDEGQTCMPQSPQCDSAKEQAIMEFDQQNMNQTPPIQRSDSVEQVIDKLEKAKLEDHSHKHFAEQDVDNSVDYCSDQYQNTATEESNYDNGNCEESSYGDGNYEESNYSEISEGGLQNVPQGQTDFCDQQEEVGELQFEVQNVGKKKGFGMMNLFENYNKALMQYDGEDTSIEYCEENQTIMYNERHDDDLDENDDTLQQEVCDDDDDDVDDDYLYGDQEHVDVSEGTYYQVDAAEFVGSELTETTESHEYNCGENDSGLFSEGSEKIMADQLPENDSAADYTVSPDAKCEDFEHASTYTNNNIDVPQRFHRDAVGLQQASWQQQRCEPSEGEC